MATISYWKKTRLDPFPPLRDSHKTDVLIVGGGMTGITVAYLLKQAGRKVTLVERDRCGQLDTGNTTAHLTCVTDRRLTQLVKSLGADHAQAVWDAGQAAIQQIQTIVEKKKIECEFQHVPGFLYASLTDRKDESRALKREADTARKLRFDANYVPDVPIFHRPGVRFPNQAKFHPLMYLARLAALIPGNGCHLYENSQATEFEQPKSDGPIRARINGATVTCDRLVIATDVPLMGIASTASAAILQTKMTPYTSYAIGAQLPRGAAPEICMWDTSDPYFYLRIDSRPRGDYAIFGGLDHKTGQVADAAARFEKLEKKLLQYLPQARVNTRWSGQVIESHDGLPIIGETAPHQYVATAYSGNGITFGTLAAMMIRDAIVGLKNPWQELFSPQRTQIRGSIWNYLSENIDYPYYMLKDRLTGSEGDSLRQLKPGKGEILDLNGQRVAAHRDTQGNITLLSPVCTHMGCIVHWNNAEDSWDCPCHGSRFGPTGNVLAGPAETPLKPIEKQKKKA